MHQLLYATLPVHLARWRPSILIAMAIATVATPSPASSLLGSRLTESVTAGGLKTPEELEALLASKDVDAMMAVIDAGVPERDKPGYLKQGLRILKAAEKIAPDDYGVLWRLARYYFWVSDDPTIPDEEKSRLGKIGWAYGDRATVANPKRVEGWFWAALDLGNYSLGIGIVAAVFQGLEGKYIERLRRAESINPKYEHGNVQCAWGRFFYVMPWPKYDAKKSESHFNKAIEMNPDNVRAHVWLAELYHEEGEDEVATALLKQALAIPINYDPPDQRRYRARAKVLLSNWSKSD